MHASSTSIRNTETTEAGEPMRNHDGSAMLDHEGRIVYRGQFLATHPLRRDLKERMVNGMLLTYMTGDGVIRTMNAAFGHDGWSTETQHTRQVVCEKNARGKWVVGYMATVKVSTDKNSHQDVGFGEATHENQLKAMDTAVKSAVTDAMKRAARHFGERLGNALYIEGNGIHTAPKDNKTALKQLEEREAMDLFGNQSALKELRALKMEAEASEQTVAREPIEQDDSSTPPPLERGVSPPSVERPSNNMNTSGQPGGMQEARDNSPSGFVRASQLPGVAVTPHLSTNRGQQRQLDTSANTQSVPPKRQKVAHNPYQHR